MKADTVIIRQEARRLSAPFINDGYVPQGLHHYTDEQENWLYSRIRLTHPEKPKIIRPFYKDSNSFRFGEPKFLRKKPLYKLPLLRDADEVYWVEGEGKVDCLGNLGIIATTSGSSTSHDGADFEVLRGKKVVIWADHDDAGLAHAKSVQTILDELECDVSLIDVEKLNLPLKGDVVDWVGLNPNATKNDVLNLPILPNVAKTKRGLILLKASELKPQPINWIWNGWIAEGKFHLLAGVAGTGKTTISLALAASVTTGGRFPDGTKSPCGNVVMWTGEDDITDTLTPRLMAMGANLERMYFVDGVVDADGKRPFNPSADMPTLEEAISKVGNVSLLIIDPIVSVINGDSHKNAEVRKDLDPLIRMSEEGGFAVLGITHFSKGTTGRDPIERITGSLAFGAVARLVLVASKSQGEDGNDGRIFVRAKSNLGPDEGGFKYFLEQAITDVGIETSRVAWGSAIDGAAKDLLGEAEAESDGGGVEGCMRLISDTLAVGSVSAKEMEKDCNGAGYSTSTMKRAKKRLGIEAIKVGMGKGSCWVWEMPKGLKNAKESHIKSLTPFREVDILKAEFGIIEKEI